MLARSKCLGVAVALVAALALVVATCSAMSIETEPVKVTHRNSGPRYDITADNEVERTRMVGGAGSGDDEREQPSPMRPLEGPARQPEGEGEEPASIGHVAIRRIYLFPVMSRGEWSGDSPAPPESSAHEQSPQRANPTGDQEQAMPSMFAKPFWPFLTPARPSPSLRQHGPAHRPHLFGADEASRSPAADQDRAASGGEREEPHRHNDHPMGLPQHQPLFDPIQMMLDMMHQAIQAQMVPPSDGDQKPTPNGLNNDNSPSESSTSDERPKMPGTELGFPKATPKPAQNETREEIVEIEGKNYLRKTIVNRHIGENIIFMTKRLIFVPLNETDSANPTTASPESVTTTTTSPTTTSATQDESTTSVMTDRVGDNKPTTTTVSSSAPTTTETPASTTTTTEEAVTMSAKGEPLSTISPESSATVAFVDRVSDVIEKAAERLVEEVKSTSTTQAPVASDKPQ